MALRGWRLFGVAGTIFAYVAGILLLSIISLNSTNPRRLQSGHFGSFDVFKHRELSILGRRPPLKWCQELHFLTDKNATSHESNTMKPTQQFPSHFLKKYEKYFHKTVPLKTKSNDQTTNGGNDKSKIKLEPIWPNRRNLRKKQPKPTEAQPHGLTALASFPGSGNTWLRYLLQQATGIYTGSVYKDFGLLKSGFPAENVCNASVLVVKTHEWGPNAWQPFSRAILLVRDPDKSIVAEFNRQSGGHVGFASPERYKRTKGRYWQQFVANKLNAWEQMNLQWAKNFTGDVHIVYYDDLVDSTEHALRSILKFINFSINEEMFQCTMSRKEGIYRRKKRIMSFDPYTEEMRAALETKKREVYATLGRYRF